MIKNERQYKITRAQLANFERALHQLEEEPDKELHPRLRQAEIDGARSQLEEMREEVAEYEKLRSGRLEAIVFESIDEMLQGLTRARIARGLSQKELGQRLNLKEQQIQRYEATDYASCSSARVAEVLQALDVRIEGKSVLRGEVNRKGNRRRALAHDVGTRAVAANAEDSATSRKSGKGR